MSLRKFCTQLAYAGTLSAATLVVSTSFARQADATLWSTVGVDAVATMPAGDELWVQPAEFLGVTLDVATLEGILATAPLEYTPEAETEPIVMTLPTPDGGWQQFQLVESPIMAPELQANYPEIRTYAGFGLDDTAACLRADITPRGFHAQVLSPNGSWYIDPAFKHARTDYVVYYRAGNESMRDGFECTVVYNYVEAPEKPTHDPDALFLTGEQLREYRLACAATGEYTQFHGGTVSLGLAAIVTTMNRVNGVYERDAAIRMNLVANNNLIVYTNSATDPYSNGSGSTMLGQNQSNLDSIIGSANYDIGHVFSTGGGGVAFLGCVCTSNKARGVTGQGSPIGDPFDIDYVAHEMGHQYGANHTFNGVNGSCSGGNRNGSTAYEPGSGTTIMAYAGICGADNTQSNSDAHFHAVSIQEMIAFAHNGTGNSCAAQTATGNADPTVVVGSGRTLPTSTPFELTAIGNDINGDSLTYCWEDWNLGPAQALSSPDNGSSCLFRSWPPTSNPTRTFPRLQDLLNNTIALGERLPTTNRSMDFIVTVRDNVAGAGATVQDTIRLTFTTSAGPFEVTVPNTNVLWGGTQTVQWDVAGTDGGAVNSPFVDIYLSIDNGLTYPYLLADDTANDGTEDVQLPSLNTTTARIKIKGADNYFFDVSDVPFEIEPAAIVMTLPNGAPVSTLPGNAVSFDVNIEENEENIVPGTAILAYRMDPNAAFTTTPLVAQGGQLYEATLPAPDCNDRPEFYVEVEGDGGTIVRLPKDAPTSVYNLFVGEIVVPFADNFETDQGWTTSATAIDGFWERGVPITDASCLNRGAPAADADGSGQAYLTKNDPNNNCDSDVDQGEVTLTSPTINVIGGGSISYAYWLNHNPGNPFGVEDGLDVEYSTNGTDWTLVRNYTLETAVWQYDVLEVGTEVPESATLQIRFIAREANPGDVLEAGIDAIVVERFQCIPPAGCAEDLDDSGMIDSTDLAILLGNFGTTSGASGADGDIDGDGDVDSSDLAMLLALFGGPCPA